jgi:anthranilate synthase component 1
MNLTCEQFTELAQKYNVIPLFDTLPADLDTPVSAFLKIRTRQYDFLLESVMGGEKWGRYSFLGTAPRKVFTLKNNAFEVIDDDGEISLITFSGNPLHVLRDEFSDLCVYSDPGLPRFFGGFVGFFGYDMVRAFDGINLNNPKTLDLPDLAFMMTDTVVIFDSFEQVMKVVNAVFIPEELRRKPTEWAALYDTACDKIALTRHQLLKPLIHEETAGETCPTTFSFTSSVSEDEFCRRVAKAKTYIEAGDIFQVVLSLKFELENDDINMLKVYRALRRINPSPYMYYLHMGDTIITGASPEILTRIEDGKITVRPIAGTRPRGLTDVEDKKLEEELLKDPKENAEHIMLVDLGRNDVGRVAKTGTVKVEEKGVVERYSHVMHLVSHVTGELTADKDCFDAIAATFPAGTLSGAPKIRAMEIIEELESEARGVYGGAVGYISFTGNADLAIAIRTAVQQGQRTVVQAGAGIVYNSIPKMEYQECVNKAKAVIKAISGL